MRAKCQREVHELHQFFEYWYNGVVARTAEAFERCEQALADDFVLISPSGRLTPRDTLVPGIMYSWGSWSDRRVATKRIRVKDFKLHHHVGDVAVVTYQEWHEGRDKSTGRLTTAVLRRKADAPNGVEWLHVHETGLPARSRLVATPTDDG